MVVRSILAEAILSAEALRSVIQHANGENSVLTLGYIYFE